MRGLFLGAPRMGVHHPLLLDFTYFVDFINGIDYNIYKQADSHEKCRWIYRPNPPELLIFKL